MAVSGSRSLPCLSLACGAGFGKVGCSEESGIENKTNLVAKGPIPICLRTELALSLSSLGARKTRGSAPHTAHFWWLCADLEDHGLSMDAMDAKAPRPHSRGSLIRWTSSLLRERHLICIT